MALSFAKGGASSIAIGARGDMTSLVEELGQKATAAGRNPPKVLPVPLDVTSRESVDNAAQTIEKELGKLDILVNNAGVIESLTKIADTDPDEWWRIWEVNIRGTYLVTRAFLPLMLKGGDKQIVNVNSIGAHVVIPGLSAYQPGKLAQARFTEFVCAEYQDQGVLAFCMHPGNVLTDIVPSDVPQSFKDGMKKIPVDLDCLVFTKRLIRGQSSPKSLNLRPTHLFSSSMRNGTGWRAGGSTVAGTCQRSWQWKTRS